ncbi:Uncharacterised protein [Klebsiella pneumoniae]|nr:hypothetical protein SM73_01281 [Klebsiella quasipneumoniae]SLY29266.1 Uncharacterised protein [Klebsiella pneumoniae]SVN30357.1 Uncharacterised protein [Klebsiella pneumoniae]SWU81346.1 Uncharacterised protein [Klebsiella pneumoniae]VGI52620.1 Uncharacterised protein [Klebsiella pneumoniae]
MPVLPLCVLRFLGARPNSLLVLLRGKFWRMQQKPH